MLSFQGNLLIEKKFLQLRVRRELEAQRLNDFLEEVSQGLLSWFSIHSAPPQIPSAFA